MITLSVGADTSILTATKILPGNGLKRITREGFRVVDVINIIVVFPELDIDSGFCS